jgi:hypothetical protein
MDEVLESCTSRPAQAAGPRSRLQDLPPRSVLIHAGLHKTGSTAIQNALAQEQTRLAACGWLYPHHGRVVDEATGHRHRQLMLELRGERRLHAWNELAAGLQWTQDRVLLSHEGFFDPRIDPQAIAHLLPGRELHALVYLRHPVDYLESSWREWVRRWRYPRPLLEWTRERSRWLEIEVLYERWEKAFGVGHVHLRPYPIKHVPDRSVVTDFCRALGLPRLESAPQANPSLGARQALVRWVANRVQADDMQCQTLQGLVADADVAAQARAQLPELCAGAGLGQRERQALEFLLSGVEPGARLMDDEFAVAIEARYLPGYLRLLQAQGWQAADLSSSWRSQPVDQGLDDPGLYAAIRLLLGR